MTTILKSSKSWCFYFTLNQTNKITSEMFNLVYTSTTEFYPQSMLAWIAYEHDK